MWVNSLVLIRITGCLNKKLLTPIITTTPLRNNLKNQVQKPNMPTMVGWRANMSRKKVIKVLNIRTINKVPTQGLITIQIIHFYIKIQVWVEEIMSNQFNSIMRGRNLSKLIKRKWSNLREAYTTQSQKYSFKIQSFLMKKIRIEKSQKGLKIIKCQSPKKKVRKSKVKVIFWINGKVFFKWPKKENLKKV